jgi:hypothetical protein
MNTPPFEKIVIHAITEDGWPVDFELAPAKGILDEAVAYLQARGFSPAPTATDSKELQWTAEGLPICPKHGEIMKKREKQGDTWYSHNVEANGQKHYCRGYAGKSSPGWNY